MAGPEATRLRLSSFSFHCVCVFLKDPDPAVWGSRSPSEASKTKRLKLFGNVDPSSSRRSLSHVDIPEFNFLTDSRQTNFISMFELSAKEHLIGRECDVSVEI